jgi:hypothetical protein
MQMLDISKKCSARNMARFVYSRYLVSHKRVRIGSPTRKIVCVTCLEVGIVLDSTLPASEIYSQRRQILLSWKISTEVRRTHSTKRIILSHLQIQRKQSISLASGKFLGRKMWQRMLRNLLLKLKTRSLSQNPLRTKSMKSIGGGRIAKHPPSCRS